MRPPRLVQLRGASGSGKSTAARELIAGLGRPNRWMIPGRKNPIALTFEKPVRPLCVVGHYGAVSTGGVDTISSRSQPYEVAREALRQGFDVFMEGILVSVELHRTMELVAAGVDRHDVFIDMTCAECTEWVHRRQEKAGKQRSELRQMEAFHRRIMRTHERLTLAGVDPSTLHVYSTSDVAGAEFDERAVYVRHMALARVRELLDVA